MHPLTSTLKSFPDFQEVPEEQISNLLEVSKLIEFKEGEFLFEPGKEATDMYIILEGNFKIGLQQKNQFRTVAELNRGSISGILPFSRRKAATGMSYATTDSKVVCIGKKYFKQIVSENYELTQALVQHMTSRVRSFTTMRQQNEKMMALGKMSAGLAHELNNPAAAIIRSSEALKEHLGMVPERFKQVLDISTTPEIVDQVNEILADRINDSTSCRLSLMERTDMEDEIADYLEDLGVDDGFEMAETFVEFHFEVDHLKSIASLLEDKDTIPVLRWVESNLITEKMVNEINEAADRISNLVNSVKAYSHMDRAPEKTKVSIHDGIESQSAKRKY